MNQAGDVLSDRSGRLLKKFGRGHQNVNLRRDGATYWFHSQHLVILAFSTNPEAEWRARTDKVRQHCHGGHPLVGHNVIVDRDGERECRLCRNARDREAIKAPHRRLRRVAVQKQRNFRKRATSSLRFSDDQLNARMAYFGFRCWMCGASTSEIDHVKPLAKGGPHILSNLRPACRSCNSRKNARWYGVTIELRPPTLRPTI